MDIEGRLIPLMDRRVKERLVGATILAVLVVLIAPAMLSGPKPRTTPVQLPAPTGPSEAVRNVTVDLATSKTTLAQDPAENTPGDSAASAAAAAEQSMVDASAANSGNATSAGSAAADEPPAAAPVPSEAAAGTPPTSLPKRGPGPPSIATLRAQQPVHPVDGHLESQPSGPTSRVSVSRPPNATAAIHGAAADHRWAVQVGSFASRENAERLLHHLEGRDASLYVAPTGKGTSIRYRVRIGPLADRDAAQRVVAKLKKEGQSASLVAP